MATSADSLAGMIAADLGVSSAPLQSEGSIGSTPVDNAPALPSQTASDAAPAPVAEPAAETPQEDEFDLDLDKDPTTDLEAEAGPEPELKPEEEKPEDIDNEFGKFLAMPRGRRIYAEFKKAQQLAKLPDEGGIGHVPSVEQTKDYFLAYTDKQGMVADFGAATENPQAAEHWAGYWFGPDDKGLFREGSAEVAANLPSFLAQSNQQAYTRLAQPVLERYSGAAIKRFMERAQTESDPAKAEQWHLAAQYLHHDLFGKYFDPQGYVGQKPQGDQIDSRLNELRQMEQRIQTMQSTQR